MNTADCLDIPKGFKIATKAPPPYLTPIIKVNLDYPKCMPVRAHPTDAGADLVATSSIDIYPGELKMVDTGVAIAIPVGYVGLVFARSSMGKVRVSLANGTGVIDSDYRGNIKVMLVNEGEDPFRIDALITRIAQLVITPVVLAAFTEGELESTNRGVGGFGSTGV